jgi:hypothetical protein
VTDDNFDAAAEAETKKLGRKKSTGAAPGEGSNQVLIRASAESHERWKEAAAKQGVSMAEFVRTAADAAASDALDCAHDAVNRRWYPFAETCLRCGMQLRDGSTWLVDPNTIEHVRLAGANPALT